MMSPRSPGSPSFAARLLATLSAFVLLSAAPLGAQTVLGTAVDAAEAAPVRGAFVILLDAEGVERDRALTSSTGAFRLRAGRPGSYRLRLERIGFEDLVTEPFELAADETVSRRLTATAQPIELSGIRVAGGEARCGIPPAEARELSRVWNEARKALEATAWTNRQSYYRFDGLIVRQVLDEDGEPQGPPEYEPIRLYGRHPFRSVQADDLAYGGWVQREGARGLKFYAPDAEVLLSDSFLSRHCFRLARDDSARNLVGVEFEPRPDRYIPEISGVLWVDRETAELRSLVYRYENLELPVDTEHIGGRVEFDHLPDGGWIVRKWEIRTPLAELDRQSRAGRREQRVRLTGLRLEGQLVLAVWRTGDVQASPGAEVPAGVAPANPPPDEIIKTYPAPEDG